MKVWREPNPLLSVLNYQALQSAGKLIRPLRLAQRWQKDHPSDAAAQLPRAAGCDGKGLPGRRATVLAVLEAEP